MTQIQGLHDRPAPSRTVITKAGKAVADGAVTIHRHTTREFVARVQGSADLYTVTWDAATGGWLCGCTASRNGWTCYHILACMIVKEDTPMAEKVPAQSFTDSRREKLTARAVNLQAERDAQHDRVRDTLSLFRGERLGEVLDLGAGVVVAEILNPAGLPDRGSQWEPLVNGRRAHERFYTRWLAVLAAVGMVHDAGSDAAMYAARVLNVPAQEG